MTARIDWLTVGGAAEPWRGLGLVAAGQDEDGCQLVPLFGAGIEIDTTAKPGLRRLVCSGVDPQTTHIDGVPIEVRDDGPPLFANHPLGASHVDHVVIVTGSLSRTCGAIADVTGAPLKRVREAGEIRQGFHRVGGSGGLIVEVVERAGLADDSASLWGFAIVVDDLDRRCRSLGPDVVSAPRDAVQPGRTIATVREQAGLGVPLALMSPDQR
jgi:hypothetical protein